MPAKLKIIQGNDIFYIDLERRRDPKVFLLKEKDRKKNISGGEGKRRDEES